MSSFLDILGITLLEGPTKDFGACIIAGLQFLRTILLHFDENREVYSKFHDSTSRSTYEGNRVLNQSSIQKALSKLYEEDIVAQLFKSWNSSHYELPQSREFLEFSWYTHFRYIHCLLIVHINCVFWPLYLHVSGRSDETLEMSSSAGKAVIALDEKISSLAWT